MEFIELPRNTMSYSNRKLVCGIGVNDADYQVNPTINGEKLTCPYYSRWMLMIKRAYSHNIKHRQPEYKNVTVCKEWHTFSNFKSWMITKKWRGLELDKDILYPMNRVYSPDACVFVPRQINAIIAGLYRNIGMFKKGVTIDKRDGKFQANYGKNGRRTYIGSFDTELEAYIAYVNTKIKYIESFYNEVDTNIKNGLIRHVKMLKETI